MALGSSPLRERGMGQFVLPEAHSESESSPTPFSEVVFEDNFIFTCQLIQYKQHFFSLTSSINSPQRAQGNTYARR